MTKNNRKAFTLIELLIVIIVLGILSSVMLLSSISALSTADTATIIGNLTSLKKATMTWYLDNYFRVVKDGSKYKVNTNGVLQEVNDFIKDHGSEITQYIDNNSSITLKVSGTNVDGDSYCFNSLNNGKEWYMGYKFFKNDKDKDYDFMEKFEARASSLNLLSIPNADGSSPKAEIFGARKDKYVYMLVLEMKD